jgi:hypothetical protein
LAPVIRLAKANHCTSKPIYKPRELRVTKLWLNWLKDVDSHTFEVSVSRSPCLGELFEGVANSVYNMLQLAHGQFGYNRFYDALSQLRYFALQVKPRFHDHTYFRRVGLRYAVCGHASGCVFNLPPS